MQATDIIHITADNTDVTNGRFSERPPRWARRVRIQVSFSDYDMAFDLHIGDTEYARACGPHVLGSANAGLLNWDAPHIVANVTPTTDIDLDVNVVTSGEGLVVIQFEG